MDGWIFLGYVLLELSIKPLSALILWSSLPSLKFKAELPELSHTHPTFKLTFKVAEWKAFN